MDLPLAAAREFPTLRAEGKALDTRPHRMGWLTPSDPAEPFDALLGRFRRDGYLFLKGFLDRPSGKLSSGQKTRVALAKSLLNEPELLLLDEPTASLDPDTGDWVRSYLEAYRARTGATMLLASHNMAEVERLCSQVLMMKAGLIVDRGSPGELIGRYGRTNLEEVFLHIARAPEFEREPAQ